MLEHQVVGTFHPARSVYTDQAKTMVGAKEAQQFLSDRRGKVGARVTGKCIVEAIQAEELEEGPSHPDGGMVGGRVKRDEIGKVVHDDMNTDVTKFVWRAAVERVNADTATLMGRLEMFDHRGDNVFLEHAAANLLADGTCGTEIAHDIVMNAMPGKEAIQIGPSLSNPTVLTVDNVRLLEEVFKSLRGRRIVNGPHEKDIELKRTRRQRIR